MTRTLDPGGQAFCAGLARHLSVISSDIAEIEVLIANLGADPNVSHQDLVTLQKIDHVQQRIGDLAVLFDELVQGDVSKVDLSNRVVLAETRRLLSNAVVRSQDTPGDVDLF